MSINNKIDFSNPGHLKLCLLSEGLQIQNMAFFEKSQHADDQFPYGYSHKFAKLYKNIPTWLLLPDDVIVSFQIRDKSPWSLIYDSKIKGIYLTHKNKKITKVRFNPKPRFYGKKLSNGIVAEKVANMYGRHVLSFFSRGWCYYFIKNVQCKFCSLSPTRKTLGKENVITVLPDLAVETAKLALRLDGQNIFYINHVAGSHKDNDLGLVLQIQILKALKKLTPKRIRHNMLTMPPDDFTLLKKLKEAGLGSLNIAIEVFDPVLFKQICPGKQLYYGYEKFLKVYDEAVKVFGEGQVYANIVCGLEPFSSMIKGFEYFATRGIVPSVNIFHPDPESKFADRSSPSISYLFEMAKAQSDIIYSNRNYVPYYPKGGTRNSIDTEIFRGFFK